jgi:hypothetical protein
MEHGMNHSYPQYAHPGAGAMGQAQGPGMGAMAQGQGYYAQGMAHPAYAYYPPHYQQQSSSLFGFANDRFLKGLVIGAAAAYLLTNESVQRTAIKGAVKVWSLLQGGVEELKERFHDAEAEIRAEAAE